MAKWRFIVFITVVFGWTCGAANLSVKIEPSNQKVDESSFEEDQLDLVLRSGTNVMDRVYLYSSYGMANAKLITDARGKHYVLVRHGRGRGTHVREEFLTVFKANRRLHEVVRFPMNGPAGDTSDWEYAYTLKRPKTGGLKFNMTLKLTGKDATWFPEDKARTVVVE